MIEELEDIRDRLRAGRYPNEAAISHGVVRRILDRLSWPVYDTDVVAPEFSIAGRRVDYALCHPVRKPIVLIEVKQSGQSSGADRQLFEYAFHQGVPMAILTDGREWHFFLPAEQGDYGERRVYKLDLIERDPSESAARLSRYLAYPRIASGAALEAARQDYKDVAKDRVIRNALPQAWRKLLTDGDELLLELVADTVESICGYKPAPEVVALFLKESVGTDQVPARSSPKPPALPVSRPISSTPQPVRTPTVEETGFELFGEWFRATSAREVWVTLLNELVKRDDGVLERFSAIPKRKGGRPYIARTPEALYPGSPHLALFQHNFRSLEAAPDWWVDVNMSRAAFERVIRLACQAAGVAFGSDVKVNLGS